MTRSAAHLEPHRRRPPTPWLLLALLLVGLTASLALDDLVSAAPPDNWSSSRSAASPGPEGRFGDPLGPLLDVSTDTLRWARGDAGGIGIALVDAGDPAAADQAAAVVAGHDAQVTWFVAGRTVADHPELLAAARRGGAELGVTGFTGRDLAGLPLWRIRTELATTQAVLAARGGTTASLLLLPAAPGVDHLDAAALRAARIAAQQGYGLVVGVDPQQVVAGQVAVVTLDGHAAERLEDLFQRIEGAGLEPMSVSRLAGLTRETNDPAGTWARANGWALLGAARAADLVVAALRGIFWPVTVLLGARALVGLIAALHHARRDEGGNWVGPVTVIVPAYNEAAAIEDTVLSVVECIWPYGLEVIVVDDGSTDGTGDIVERLGLRDVWVIRQPNSGKPAALNAAVAAARTEIVVLLDGDTMFQPDTIARLVAPFSDARVGASSGNAKVWNRTRLLGRWQHIEYVMGFNLDRRLLAVCHAIPTVPGAIGAFRVDALRQAGGISDDTLAEDTDLTIAVSRQGWRVVYRDDALAWTEAPFTTGDLWRQRYRWSYGTLQAVWKHRGALREPRSIGLVGLPYALLFQVVLPVLAPVVDVYALYTLVGGGAIGVLWAWVAFTAANLGLAAVAFRLDRERLRTLWALPLQQVFYRQLMYLVVIQALVTAVTGNRLRWHKLRRVDSAAATTPERSVSVVG